MWSKLTELEKQLEQGKAGRKRKTDDAEPAKAESLLGRYPSQWWQALGLVWPKPPDASGTTGSDSTSPGKKKKQKEGEANVC